MTQPLGKTIGSARAQFIAEVRKAVRYTNEGRPAELGMKSIAQALKVLDRGKK